MAATAGALSSVMAKFGRAERARSLNNRTASKASRDLMSTAPCSSGTERQGTRQTTSPLTPSCSREVARRASRAQLRTRASARAAAAVSTCSQLSSTMRTSRSASRLRKRVGVGLVADLLDPHGGHDGARDQVRVGQP